MDAHVQEQLLERLVIRERIDLYVDLINHRDWDAYEQMLTEDFVFSVGEPVNYRTESRASQMTFMRDEYSSGFTFQMPHAVVIELIDETHARSRHTLQVLTDKFTATGIYYDELVKDDDSQWRFRRRDFMITHYDDSQRGGRTYRTFPQPGYRDLPAA